MLLNVSTANKLVVHPTAGGAAQKMFALEDLCVGGGIDDAYAASTIVRAGVFQAGSKINALLAAAAAAVVIGDALESAGDGTVRKQATSDTKASLTISGADANGDLTFTSVLDGAAGNDIQIVIETPTASPSVVVSGLTITITPDDTTPTATEVAAQIAASVPALALVTCAAGGTGASAPGTDAGSNLAGGIDAYGIVGSVVGYATEAVDNSGGGTTARIQLRVA